MNPTLNIFDKQITKVSPVLIIAEIGINHMGDEELCRKMIVAALKNGADCVKLQTGFVDESFAQGTKSYEIFKNSELKRESLLRLKKIAEDNKGYMFSSPGDFSSINLLESIDIKAYKISSGQFTNLPLIKEVLKRRNAMILSTGMATLQEISHIYNFLKNEAFNNFAFLHTISQYPANINQLNLGFINRLSTQYNIISGYSDHSIGELACLSAVASGAKIIEKHFTIDCTLPGGDNKISMPPKPFKEMCEKIRNIEKMYYSCTLKPHPDELKLKKYNVRKVVAKIDINVGEKVTIEKVNFMRVNNEDKYILAYDWYDFVGKRLKKKVRKNQLFNKEDFN